MKIHQNLETKFMWFGNFQSCEAAYDHNNWDFKEAFDSYDLRLGRHHNRLDALYWSVAKVS